MGLYEKISSMLDIITEGGLSTHLTSPLLKIPRNVALVLQLPQQNQLKFIHILLLGSGIHRKYNLPLSSLLQFPQKSLASSIL